MFFTIYNSNNIEDPKNCLYQKKIEVIDLISLKRAVTTDYVCAEYKDNYRKNNNFIKSNCLALDCDNDHSDVPEKWINPSDIAVAFPNVKFAVHYSRHHMKEKDGKSARPKFHVFFAIDPITDVNQYGEMKKNVNKLFPFFDPNALDASRFFFGTKDPEVEIIEGPMTLTEFLADSSFNSSTDSLDYETIVIPAGKRNSTLSRFAGRVLKRLGDTKEAYDKFLKLADSCQPHLEQRELDNIWQSAKKFFKKISTQKGYIPPNQYNHKLLLLPEDCSDVGQATVLSNEYKNVLRYSPSTKFLVYNGSYWEESEPKAQGIAQLLTTRQLLEAEAELKRAEAEMKSNGAWDLLATLGKKAFSSFNKEQKRSYRCYEDAKNYRNYVIKRRDSKYITASLKEARPMLEINPKQLDANGFLLNTPSGTYDLHFGSSDINTHDASDFITKQTEVDPNLEGIDIWMDSLKIFFCGDEDLISYVQEITGLAIIGKVLVEGLIIAYGEGRNGKSTFWNVIARVLGSYSGNISADALTVGCKRNVKPELAEVRGKRLIIAAELEEGTRLSTSNVKQLCSTDEIYAEKKYKDPFSFVPTHTLVLYTNHLPKVSALDEGTWRRLIVIPFNATIEGSSDIKNYADYLFANASGAILTWIMNGAKRVINNNYHITKPSIVEDATSKYRESNNWLKQFFQECCDIKPDGKAKSGEVYTAYRNYCSQAGEYTRSTTDFYTALEMAGIEKHKTKSGMMLHGMELKSDFME